MALDATSSNASRLLIAPPPNSKGQKVALLLQVNKSKKIPQKSRNSTEILSRQENGIRETPEAEEEQDGEDKV